MSCVPDVLNARPVIGSATLHRGRVHLRWRVCGALVTALLCGCPQYYPISDLAELGPLELQVNHVSAQYPGGGHPTEPGFTVWLGYHSDRCRRTSNDTVAAVNGEPMTQIEGDRSVGIEINLVDGLGRPSTNCRAGWQVDDFQGLLQRTQGYSSTLVTITDGTTNVVGEFAGLFATKSISFLGALDGGPLRGGDRGRVQVEPASDTLVDPTLFMRMAPDGGWYSAGAMNFGPFSFTKPDSGTAVMGNSMEFPVAEALSGEGTAWLRAAFAPQTLRCEGAVVCRAPMLAQVTRPVTVVASDAGVP